MSLFNKWLVLIFLGRYYLGKYLYLLGTMHTIWIYVSKPVYYEHNTFVQVDAKNMQVTTDEKRDT